MRNETHIDRAIARQRELARRNARMAKRDWQQVSEAR